HCAFSSRSPLRLGVLLAEESEPVGELRRPFAGGIEPALELDVLALEVRHPLVDRSGRHRVERELLAALQLADARLRDLRAPAERDHLLADRAQDGFELLERGVFRTFWA